MRLWGWLAVAGALAGCQSTLKGVKLDETGSIAATGAENGVPYTLTRPKFQVLKDDKDKYSVAVSYVPDPSQRYSLRIDPALLADTTFKMTWGENGGLTGLTASATDQAAPTLVALLKMSANVATGLASPLGLAEGTRVESGCLALPTAAQAIKCAMERTGQRAQLLTALKAAGVADTPDPAGKPCTAGMVTKLEARMTPFISDGEDKGDVVASLYPLTDEEAQCFTAAAQELRIEAVEAVTKKRPTAALPATDPNPIVGVRVLALEGFDKHLAALDATMTPKPSTSAIAQAARPILEKRVDPAKPDDYRALAFAVMRYLGGPVSGYEDGTEREQLYKLLGVADCKPKPKPGAPPAPAPPACDTDDAVVAALSAGFEAAGLDTKLPGARLDLIARADPLSKGLVKAATVEAADWRKRHIARLDRDEALAVRAALMRPPPPPPPPPAKPLPPTDPAFDPAVVRIRTERAAVVELSKEYARLVEIRKRLETAPKPVLDTRLSPTGEQAALEQEALRIETLLAARLAAAAPPSTAKTAAAEELPGDTPWVSKKCITASKGLAGWSYLEGKKAPDYVIVLRRADGTQVDAEGEKVTLEPASQGCPA